MLHSITVDRNDLLETLRRNRDRHRADYLVTFEAFRKRAASSLRQLADRADRAEPGDDIRLSSNLQVPQDHTKDYDHAIAQLEWHTENTLELDYSSFMQLVQDEWSWKQQFTQSSTFYTGSASPSSVRI